MKNQRGSILPAFLGAIALAIVVLFGGWALASWQKVPAGNVGVKVYLLGNEKGVDNQVLGVGRYFIGWQQELYLYPTFTQNYVWTKEDTEGSPGDESITFQDIQGLTINADVGISYHVDPAKAADLFQKYRLKIGEITDGVLRNYVRNAINDEASKLNVEQIYGSGKEAMMARVQDDVSSQVGKFGIVVEKIYLTNGMRLPTPVLDALNAKITATQKAQMRQNEVAQAQAEADKVRATAQGEADAKLMVAKADAQAIQIKGEALRQNQELVSLTIAERWDGKMPTQLLSGGNGGGPIVQLLAPSK